MNDTNLTRLAHGAVMEAIRLREEERQMGGRWIKKTVDGYYFQALVFDEPSEEYGINGGRVSKLTICEGNKWDPSKVVYNYDRGLEFNDLPSGVLEKVLRAAGN